MKTKPSLWKTIFGALKEAIKTYRALINEQKEKHRLLTSHSDWSMIETFIQKCNDNPDLKVTIRLLDGTTIIMTAYKPQQLSINQQLDAITVEL